MWCHKYGSKEGGIRSRVLLEKVAFIFTYVERQSKSLHSPWFGVYEYQNENH